MDDIKVPPAVPGQPRPELPEPAADKTGSKKKPQEIGGRSRGLSE